MKYNIFLEGHCGVAEVDEEFFGSVEADTEEQALEILSKQKPAMRWSDHWKIWVVGEVRKLIVRQA
jgi:hypothetical protein